MIQQLENRIIATLRIRRPDGLHVVAFCPICDQAEESRGHVAANQRSLDAAVERIREHMRLRHRPAVVRR